MVPAIRALAFASEITALVEAVLGAPGRPVRGIFFDKTAQANWPVPWHQDLTIALAERRELPGWTQWSIKSGVHHVQPPTAFLERMITLRLHVDDCDEDNGPLRVLPGSHRMGRLTREKISELTNGCREIICTAPKGSALVVRPLLLHASSPAKRPRHRRVIHLEFAMTDSLPCGLSWLPLQ
jgi:ectoine hydroxylase-related dioxygenase (phytanoyl-CoA dioxygenase family)